MHMMQGIGYINVFATTHVLSHHYLDTAESIEQSCYCGSDAVQDNFDNFATSTPQKNCALLMPFNCMSFSTINM